MTSVGNALVFRMAAYFGGSSVSRRPLIDHEIEEILGDGNISEIDDIDVEDEVHPFSLLDWLENDVSENAVDEPEPVPTTKSTLVVTPDYANLKKAKGTHRTATTAKKDKIADKSRAIRKSNRTAATTVATTSSDPKQPASSHACTTSSAGTSKTRRTNRASQPWKQIPFQNMSHEYLPCPTRAVRNPIDYFNEYMDDNFFEHISVCTNMYHLRKTGNELKTSPAEIKKLFGIHALMGCIPYPRWKMYWRRGISMDMITSKMTRDRFGVLRNALHVVDCDTPKPGDDNPLWKVQPMINQIRKGCYNQERVPGFYSVDEQMIPFTGRCVLRQVVKNKPRPVGLKNFVLTTSSGLMLDFDIYRGAKTMFGADMSLGLGPSVVLHLSRSVPPGSCLYHDRYFTTIPLIEELGKRNLHSTGTIMLNRIPERTTLKFKQDKMMARGESQQMVRGEVTVVKWKDNKSVFLASNCSGSDKDLIVKRWEKKAQSYIDVTAPQVIINYNRHMGGVDVLDQLMEYYRTFIKTKKWTLKVLIHFFDLAIVNSWRAYKIDCEANNFLRSNTQDLLDFRMEIHEVLTNAPEKRRSEAAVDASDGEITVPRNYARSAKPPVSLRYDGYNHLAMFDDIKSPRACQLETCCSRTKTRCIKCNVYLCISRNQNCFTVYHSK